MKSTQHALNCSEIIVFWMNFSTLVGQIKMSHLKKSPSKKNNMCYLHCKCACLMTNNICDQWLCECKFMGKSWSNILLFGQTSQD